KDIRGLGAALTGLAMIEWEDMGRRPEALRLLEEARELGHSNGYARLEYGAIHDMASIYDWSGDKQRALWLYQQSVSLARAARVRLRTALTLNEMAYLYTQWGDYRRARDLHTETLALVRQVGNRVQETWILLHLGRLDEIEGNSDRAVATLDSALKLS